MKRINSALLLATVASMALASGASAQSVIAGPIGPNDGDGALHGAGATAIQNVLVQELNCIGGNNQLGGDTGSLTTIAEPTSITTPAGSFNCATQELQPNFEGKYVGTGSGFGRQAWRNNSNQFGLTGRTNPFGTWNTVQFAFSESSASQSDLAAYDNATTGVRSIGGAPIMFPKFVLPVAVAYDPVYGKKGATSYRFNVTTPGLINGTNVGGLRLNRVLYCGIFNGDIKNFNDSRFSGPNGSTSLRDPQDEIDNPGRWGTDGVPIRLVGRLERSGTTDIFTRALAAQCNGLTGVTSKYLNNSDALPYNSSSGVNFVTERPDTGLRPGGGATAGTTNLIGREWFNPAGTGSIQVAASDAGGQTSYPTGAVGSGLYLVANGSGSVSAAIRFAPDYASPSAPGVLLNGKIGYIGADFIANAPAGNPSLFAAALNQGSGFELPSAQQASDALGSIAPPQSDSLGAFQLTDTRQVRPVSGSGTVNATRANPLAWYDVLYPTALTGLAFPSDGYALTGTTQVLANTCYKASNRQFVVNFLGWNTDGVTRDSANADRTGVFTNTSTGLLALSNIGALPASWKRAVTQTFLTNSTEVSSGTTLGNLNLWIQSTPTPGGAANTSANGCGGGKTGI